MAIDPRFLNGVIIKTAIIGGVMALGVGLAFNQVIGIGIAAGALVSVLNLRFVVWSLGKLFDAARGNDGGSSAVWTILLGSKMAILMAIVWFLLSVGGVDAVGFTIGFSAFLPAILWQLFSGPKPKRG